jgi:hypothetical protein
MSVLRLRRSEITLLARKARAEMAADRGGESFGGKLPHAVRYVYHRALRHSMHRDEVPAAERAAAERLILEAATR